MTNTENKKAYCCPEMRQQAVEKGNIVFYNGKKGAKLKFLKWKELGSLETEFEYVPIEHCPFCGSCNLS